MELEVYWTQFSEDTLFEIYKYYNLNFGNTVAQNLVEGIIDESLKLSNNPFIGQREHLLIDRVQEFRYLIYKNYKIIYWIDEIKKTIFISHVFDTRQNPIKLNSL